MAETLDNSSRGSSTPFGPGDNRCSQFVFVGVGVDVLFMIPKRVDSRTRTYDSTSFISLLFMLFMLLLFILNDDFLHDSWLFQLKLIHRAVHQHLELG